MRYSKSFYSLVALSIAACTSQVKTVPPQAVPATKVVEQKLHTDSTANSLFVPEGFEAKVWAESPQFYNPTNMDVDIKGRIWITEAVNYRDFKNLDALKHPEGDRVMILEDTDGDGTADSSKEFVQDKDLIAPLGILVRGNKVFVSSSPSVIVYTDENGDDKADKKEVFLTGFGGKDHDHGLHSGVVGPDGKLYFNTGNQGPHIVTDKSGWTLRSGSIIVGGSPYSTENTPGLKSDDGKVYTGGLAFRVNPDGTGLEVMAHNFRNSYEVFVDSYGDMWQNDNDDQIATCRTSWVMEGANAGYLSNKGERQQQADRRPGQSVPVAQWHQEDPGIMPAGDIYGSGSPTGIVVNEGDALGKQYRGLLLSADAGRNIIFGYMPGKDGAGYHLSENNRTNFIASVQYDNKDYRWSKVEDDKSKWFRPSDVAIGTDGAIYVADFYDPIVGGHQMIDKKGYGRIYRIAPKGSDLKAPKIDLSSTTGQITALLNPAINVRSQGFESLKAQGERVLPEVKDILSAENPYHRARATWLLSKLGKSGINEVETLLKDTDPNIRITALRALRQANPKGIPVYAKQLVNDESAAVRRDVALSLKDLPFETIKPLILTLADGYDGKDRWYLNALGTALGGKEEASYPVLLSHFQVKDPETWPQQLADLVWELHPQAAVKPLRQRALSSTLPLEEKKRAMVALAFIPSQSAANAMLRLLESKEKPIVSEAQYWLQFRKTNDWKEFLKEWKAPEGLSPDPHPELLALRNIAANNKLTMNKRISAAAELVKTKPGKLHMVQIAQGLPDSVLNAVETEMLSVDDRYLKPAIEQFFKPGSVQKYNVDSIAALPGDFAKGRILMFGNCLVCHKRGEAGGELGPVLTNIYTKLGKNAMIGAIVDPDAGIEFGSEAYLVTLKNGGIVYGIMVSNGPVVTIMDIYGRRYIIGDSEILAKKRLVNSPMPSPVHMNLSQQDVANITAYLLTSEF